MMTGCGLLLSTMNRYGKLCVRKISSQYSLIKDYGFSTGTLDALRKNKSVTLNTIHDICTFTRLRAGEML